MNEILTSNVMPALVLPFEALASWHGMGTSEGHEKTDHERACDASVGLPVSIGGTTGYVICNNIIDPAPYGIVAFDDEHLIVVGCAENKEDELVGHARSGNAKLLGELDLSVSGKLAVIDAGSSGSDLEGAGTDTLYVRQMTPGVYLVHFYEIIDRYSLLIIDKK